MVPRATATKNRFPIFNCMEKFQIDNAQPLAALLGCINRIAHCESKVGACALSQRIGSLLVALLLAVPAQAGTACDPDPCRGMIGKPFSAELAEEARLIAGAKSVRPSGPGIPTSADVRGDRLNVLLDEKHIVVGFRCG
ncbi:hypothetical protein [Bradyrhizobium sp. CCBAU 25360]|uniref:hypothetical protein n=1 Tax=Bradyrhizobium sp. CCBAU 25360 TaxID=858425 RepID=UPI002306C49C|nr:hypothetical protein [Bradyrhizobium sp. CCBAU 25360]